MIIHCQNCNRKGSEGWIHQTCVSCCKVLDPGQGRYKKAIEEMRKRED